MLSFYLLISRGIVRKTIIEGAMMNGKTIIFRQWARIVLGLLVFAFGVHLTIYANIGLAPWDCLGMGIAKHTPLNLNKEYTK